MTTPLGRWWSERGRSVVRSWLISYLSVLLVPVAISAFVYLEALNLVASETNRANQASLVQLREELDGRLRDIKRVSLEIALNPSVNALVHAPGPLESTHRYSIYQLLQSFGILRITNSFMDDFHIVLPKSDCILTSRLFVDGEYARLMKEEFYGFSYAEWVTLFEGRHDGEFRSVSVASGAPPASHPLLYLQTIPIQDPSLSSGTIVVVLNRAALERYVAAVEYLQEGSSVSVLDRNGNVIAGQAVFAPWKPLSVHELPRSMGSIDTVADGKEVVLSYAISETGPWTYISVVPTSLYVRKAMYLRRLAFIGILGCMALGGIVAYLLSKRNYAPVRELVQYVASETHAVRSRLDNEFQFIRKMIGETVDEKSRLEDILRRQDSVVKANTLSKLLRGGTEDDAAALESLYSESACIRPGLFWVLLFYLEDVTQPGTGDAQADAEGRAEMGRFIVAHVLEAFVAGRHNGFVTEVGGMIACLVNTASDDRKSIESEVMQATRDAQSKMRNDFGVHVTASIGEPAEHATELHGAYMNALEAMEYRMLLGMDSIIRYGDIRGPAPLKRYRYTLKVEQQLINHIHMGNFDEAQVILDNVVWSGLTDKDISVNMARCLMFDLVGTMLKAIDEIHLNSEDTYFDSVKPVDMLMRCKTIDELKRNFTSFLEDVCREVADHKKQQTSEMNGAVKSYVEEQYRDKNLSVSSIAEWFHRNPVYLSRVFKEETGCGLAEYIAMVRMEHAKRLLSEEHRSVKSVAHDVGFPDSAAFIRMFKRTAGITPGQYKDM